MQTQTKIVARLLVLAAAGWFAGCNSSLEDDTNVVLEVAKMTIPPVTAANVGGCVLTVTNGTADLNNKMKNAKAGGPSDYPYNDILLESIHVDYVWDDGIGVTAADFPVIGTVAAGGTLQLVFTFVNLTDLVASPVPRDGHTASMKIYFKGHTVAGDPVVSMPMLGGAALNINSCPPSP